MEAVGAVSSVFAIYNQLELCGKRLHRLKHNFRIAKEEVNLLTDEVSACQALFGIFRHVSRPLENRVMQLARQEKLEETLQSQAAFAYQQISEITSKLEPLRKQSNANRFDQFIAKLRWHWTKDDIQLPLLTLASVKISLTAFTCLLFLDSCLANMKRPSLSEAEIRSLKTQMKHLRRTIKRQEKCLRRLSTRLTEFVNTSSQPALVVNTRLMVVAINQITEAPLAEARTFVDENFLYSATHTSNSPPNARSLIAPTMSLPQSPLGIPTGGPRSSARLQSLSQDDPCSEVDTLARRDNLRETRAVVHDYGDGNREIYEVAPSRSPSIPDGFTDTFNSTYAPLPPFDYSDLRLRKQRK